MNTKDRNDAGRDTSTDATAQMLAGYALSPGIGIGLAYVYEDLLQQTVKCRKIRADEIQHELKRLDRAVGQVSKDLEKHAGIVSRELNQEASEVFEAHQAIVQDAGFRDRVVNVLEDDLVNLETAVRIACNDLANEFAASDSTVVAAKADDVGDIARRLLRFLLGWEAHQLDSMPPKSILVARYLHPSDTVFLTRKRVAGIAVERAGKTSHMAILTREAGIPAVAGIERLLSHVQRRNELLVNGFEGELLVEPSPAQREAGRRREKKYARRLADARKASGQPVRRPDGSEVSVLANVSRPDDAVLAQENGADGIGLHRIEHLFLARSSLPDADELRGEIESVIQPFKQKPVTIRLLDSGGDKKLPYLDYPEEENPMLGLRGVRFLRHYPDLLRLQLRVLLSLADDYDLRLMVPMVTRASDMEYVRHEMDALVADMDRSEGPPLGAMIEIPAAALDASRISRKADFFSIGTNDLTQYTMAAGRENEDVIDYYQDDSEPIWKLVEMVCASVDIPVEVCGELAAETGAVGRLLAAGVDAVSIPPLRVPLIKQDIRLWARDQQ